MGVSKDVENFVKVRAAEESAPVLGIQRDTRFLPRARTTATVGRQLSGAELVAAAPIINEIADSSVAQKIRGMFQIYTKYEALNILMNPNNEITKRFPTQIARLVETMTETDRKSATTIREAVR